MIAGNSHAVTPQSPARHALGRATWSRAPSTGAARTSRWARSASGAVGRHADCPANDEPGARGELPGLQQREARQPEPPRPHGVLGRGQVSGEPPARGAGDLDRAPLSAPCPATSSSPPAASYSGHADFMNGWNSRALGRARRRLPEREDRLRLSQRAAVAALAATPATASWFSAWRIRCSTCQRSAVDSPRSIASSSACAASSCACARASSISDAATGASTSAIARFSSTWKNPGPVAYSSTSAPSPGWTRVEPGLAASRSAARAGRARRSRRSGRGR